VLLGEKGGVDSPMVCSPKTALPQQPHRPSLYGYMYGKKVAQDALRSAAPISCSSEAEAINDSPSLHGDRRQRLLSAQR
jgi:hypothetical protein